MPFFSISPRRPRLPNAEEPACVQAPAKTQISQSLVFGACLLINLHGEDAHAQVPCATVGTGQLVAANECTVAATSIDTTSANPEAIRADENAASVTANGVTANLRVLNAFRHGHRQYGHQCERRDADGGRLKVSARNADQVLPVRAHAAAPGEFIAISIEDTGSGIEPDALGRIFEPSSPRSR